MPQDDITQIKVGGHRVGVIGLKRAIEEIAEDSSHVPDDEIQAELLNLLSGKNYIPDLVKECYGKAFLREFKKFLGKPYEEEAPDGVEIKVLGPGCAQCDRLERELIAVMAEMDLAAELEHVTDIQEIGRYGVMGTPALIINGKVKSVGKVPTRSQLKSWLTEAKK